MARTITVLDVLVSSPHEVAEERAIVREVVDQLNQTLPILAGIELRPFLWEEHVPPGFGDSPQDVIDAQIPTDYDIYLGILWTRFGTPTSSAGSGTESEFRDALSRYEADARSVDIMLYFKKTPASLDRIDPAQLAKVRAFEEEVSDLGIYVTFEESDEFRQRLLVDLTNKVKDWQERTGTEAREERRRENSTAVEAAEQPTEQELEELEEGLLDLLERGTVDSQILMEVAAAIALDTNELGADIGMRSAELESLPEGDPARVGKAKRILIHAAADIERFVRGMEKKIPEFADKLGSVYDAWTRAATLVREDFGGTDPTAAEAVQAVTDLGSTLSSTHESVNELRAAIASLPRTTMALMRAQARAVDILDEFANELTRALRLNAEVTASFEALVPGYE